MLLLIEIGIRGAICDAIYRYAKANNKCMKYYDENKESSYLIYCNVNNLCGQEMPQKLLVNYFKRVKDMSKFDESYKKI